MGPYRRDPVTCDWDAWADVQFDIYRKLQDGFKATAKSINNCATRVATDRDTDEQFDDAACKAMLEPDKVTHDHRTRNQACKKKRHDTEKAELHWYELKDRLRGKPGPPRRARHRTHTAHESHNQRPRAQPRQSLGRKEPNLWSRCRHNMPKELYRQMRQTLVQRQTALRCEIGSCSIGLEANRTQDREFVLVKN